MSSCRIKLVLAEIGDIMKQACRLNLLASFFPFWMADRGFTFGWIFYNSLWTKELTHENLFLSYAIPQDNSPSLAKRVKKSDAREIESFYQQYYENYVRALDKGEQADR
jgi:hypothetical protein